jgi:CDP-glycerol glycerophosphotransferase (TagB/SpsB family)
MKSYLLYVSQLYSLAVLRPIQEVIKNRGDRAVWFFEHPEHAVYLKSTEEQLSNVETVRKFNPVAVFVAGNLVPDFFPGVKVQVFHGFQTFKRPGHKGHFRIRGFYDLYCTHGPSTTLPFEALAEDYKYFEVVETGWPKLDPLFNDPQPKEVNNPPVIFLTSTFTPSLSCAGKLFETVHQISKNGPWKWLINFHPLMDSRIVNKYRSIQNENLEYVDTDDIIPLLKKADVLVSDTSSIVTEFLVLQKPAVTFRNRKPGSHLVDISTSGDLADAVSLAFSKPRSLMENIAKYVNSVHPYRDGRSSFRALNAADRLIEKGLSHLKPKPLNLIRRIKIRKYLHYYRWN